MLESIIVKLFLINKLHICKVNVKFKHFKVIRFETNHPSSILY